MPSNQALIDYVQRATASGAQTIEVPASLLVCASKEAVDEMRRYCKLCGVEMVVRA